MDTKCLGEGEGEHYKQDIFDSENNHSLEQPPQGHGTVPITRCFQCVIG